MSPRHKPATERELQERLNDCLDPSTAPTRILEILEKPHRRRTRFRQWPLPVPTDHRNVEDALLCIHPNIPLKGLQLLFYEGSDRVLLHPRFQAHLERCADPQTPPQDLLSWVHIDIRMWRQGWRISPAQKALAHNPSLPLEGLAELIRILPDIVLSNPSFQMHLATDLSTLKKIKPRVFRTVDCCEKNGPSLVRYVATTSRDFIAHRIEAAANISCPTDLMYAFAKQERTVRSSLAANPSLPPNLFRPLASDHPEVRIKIAAHRGTPPDVLAEMVYPHQDVDVLNTLAHNDSVPQHAWEKVKAKHPVDWNRVAKNRAKNKKEQQT